MIITIDTTKDSQADIQKAIALLQQIANGSYQNYSNNSYQNQNAPVNSAFDWSTPSSNSQSAPQSSSAPVNGFAAMFDDANVNSTPSITSYSGQPLTNVAAQSTSNPVPKKREKYDFETY